MAEFTAALRSNDALHADTIGNTSEVTLRDSFRTLIDSFEDQDIAEYSGDTGSFTVGDSASGYLVKDGTYGLEGATTATGGTQSLVSTSGLPAYPDQGETFEFWIGIDDADTMGQFAFFTQSSLTIPDGYVLRLTSTSFKLLDRASGFYDTMASASVSVSTQTPYRITCTPFADGTIRARLYDEAGTQLKEITGTDSSFTDGGIAFEAANSASDTTTVRWDAASLI